MKDYLKYLTILMVCGTAIILFALAKSCGEVGQTADLVVIPADSGYLPVTYRDYKPKSTPFEKPVKPVSKLPKSVKERDVKRVIVLTSPSAKKNADKHPLSLQERGIMIIETNDGNLYVEKNDDSLSLVVTNYLPPIFQFGLFYGVGLSFNNVRTSPSLSVAFVRVNEKFLAPVLAADVHGVGVGIGYQFYHDLSITPLLMWNYSDTQRTIKIQVSYQL